MGDGLDIRDAGDSESGRQPDARRAGRNGTMPEWKARVEFVPFPDETRRADAYRTWARLFLAAKRKELEPGPSLKGKRPAEPSPGRRGKERRLTN
ncbi:MAG: hypothetical protein AB1512_02950 [Thermodesulfobacteriota bacterium]